MTVQAGQRVYALPWPAHFRQIGAALVPIRNTLQVGRQTFVAAVEIELVGERSVCRRLTLQARDGCPPLTSDDLRSLPLRRLLVLPDALMWPHSDLGDLTDADVRATQRRLHARGARTSRRAEDHLRRVAAAYNQALADHKPPIEHLRTVLARQMNRPGRIPRSTASGWVVAARRAGFLPPTRPGSKKGGPRAEGQEDRS